MVESGDWLTPRFNYQASLGKAGAGLLADRGHLPGGRTQRIRGATVVRAVRESGSRCWRGPIARHATSRLDVAWLAGAIVATSFGYFAMARAALPDLPLTFCITLTNLGRAASHRRRQRAWRSFRTGHEVVVLAGASAGAGFLMKGPVALVVPALVLLPIAWREWRRLRFEARSGRGRRDCRDRRAAVVRRDVARARQPIPSELLCRGQLRAFCHRALQRGAAVLVLSSVLLGGLLPWSLFLTVFVVEGLAGARKRTLKLADADWRLLLWAIMPLLFFTLSVGKQPRYILPVLPPLAVLLARGLIERIETRRNPAGRSARRRGQQPRCTSRSPCCSCREWSRC